MNNKPVILTGIRANGELHLGNFLGAILPMVDLQAKHKNNYQINMFVADMHSITTPVDFGQLQGNIWSNLRTYVAAGLDLAHTDTFVYRQSHIAAHGELAWYLACFTGYGEAQRMTEFKEKAGRLDGVNVGLFSYPILMSADILLYDAEWVPVGEDQRQHLELCREIALRMNSKLDCGLTVPHETKKQIEFRDRDQAPRIRSLSNPAKKMSKSIDDPRGTILLSDAPAAAAKKIKSAETDSVGVINWDWDNQPGITNLLQIYQLLSGKMQADVAAMWQGKSSYGDLKSAVADSVSAFLADFQAKLAQVSDDDIRTKLEQSEQAMQAKAIQTLQRVQTAVGLRARN